ncbi:lengsin-like [Acanthaster planci]|uniref:Lengsin n=1 Tax=Acanthaster planci TaxID=133434 RepID=A0A8B7Z0C3_ACAPL|nr:lengsin-like [Acanthaster planci]
MTTLLDVLEKREIKYVRLEFGDMNGISRCKVIPSRHVQEKFTEGIDIPLAHFGMDTSSNLVLGTGYGTEICWDDGVFLPDLATFRFVPWLPDTAMVLTEPTYRGNPMTSYPRYIAGKQLEHLQELGYTLLSAHEHEFYVVDAETKKPLHKGNLRSSLSIFRDADLLYAFSRNLTGIGVNVEAFDTELSPGQVEITYKPAFGIRAADNAHIYRTTIKEVAQRHGYIASFMSKPWEDQCGSSAHFCHSLWDASGKKGVMYDPKDDLNISEVAQHWIAGILAHAPAISLLMAPTTNCQKRFKPFSFAPINATWGIANRTCALRLKVKGEVGTYLENRMGASGSNPYLSLAATVAAGIDGITKKLPLPARVTGDAYVQADVPADTRDLPSTLSGAVEAFEEDSVITEAFGPEFCKAFLAVKRYEIEKGMEAQDSGDTEWEFRNYFEMT